MKIILTILAVFVIIPPSLGQTDNSYNLMPQPASLTRNGERFTIDQHFSLSISGSPDQRIYAEASRFIRRMGERTGYFLDKQGYVTANDNSLSAPLLVRI